MNKGKIIILSGPSGSGKTTLHKKLLLNQRLKRKVVKSISVTTRHPRRVERNRRDYVFISRKLFLYKRRSGHFLEWQKVFDNYYGTPKRSIEEAIRSGKSVLLCIDVKGARVVAQKYPDAVKVFIRPPSLKILRERLKNRDSETPESLCLRLNIARREMQEAKHYQYVIVNDRLTKALHRLESIISREIT